MVSKEGGGGGVGEGEVKSKRQAPLRIMVMGFPWVPHAIRRVVPLGVNMPGKRLNKVQ